MDGVALCTAVNLELWRWTNRLIFAIPRWTRWRGSIGSYVADSVLFASRWATTEFLPPRGWHEHPLYSSSFLRSVAMADSMVAVRLGIQKLINKKIFVNICLSTPFHPAYLFEFLEFFKRRCLQTSMASRKTCWSSKLKTLRQAPCAFWCPANTAKLFGDIFTAVEIWVFASFINSYIMFGTIKWTRRAFLRQKNNKIKAHLMHKRATSESVEKFADIV